MGERSGHGQVLRLQAWPGAGWGRGRTAPSWLEGGGVLLLPQHRSMWPVPISPNSCKPSSCQAQSTSVPISALSDI